jgi:hypothetical protein
LALPEMELELETEAAGAVEEVEILNPEDIFGF